MSHRTVAILIVVFLLISCSCQACQCDGLVAWVSASTRYLSQSSCPPPCWNGITPR
ncbi:MAG: hypothetical protein GXY52_00595 [Chloroflexi bacterium]|nr:hypothetical protein [Chloroflexota bacterium]